MLNIDITSAIVVMQFMSLCVSLYVSKKTKKIADRFQWHFLKD